MQIITWSHPCHICHRPMLRGKPTLILSTVKPDLIGVAHSSCSIIKIGPGCFQTCPPFYLSSEQVSFLVQFYPMLFDLPGGFEPNGILRSCVGSLLYPYPESMIDPLTTLRKERNRGSNKGREYNGDLEMDFLKFLGQVQRMAKENPVEVEVDFKK